MNAQKMKKSFMENFIFFCAVISPTWQYSSFYFRGIRTQSHLNGFLVKKNKHSSTLLYSRAGFLLFVILQSHVTQNS